MLSRPDPRAPHLQAMGQSTRLGCAEARGFSSSNRTGAPHLISFWLNNRRPKAAPPRLFLLERCQIWVFCHGGREAKYFEGPLIGSVSIWRSEGGNGPILPFQVPQLQRRRDLESLAPSHCHDVRRVPCHPRPKGLVLFPGQKLRERYEASPELHPSPQFFFCYALPWGKRGRSAQ